MMTSAKEKRGEKKKSMTTKFDTYCKRMSIILNLKENTGQKKASVRDRKEEDKGMRRTIKTRRIGRALTLIMALCMMFMLTLPVMAEGESEGTGALVATEDPRDSVMLISLGYQDDAGNYYDYKWGTCFLINDEYVLTNKHVVTLSDEEFNDFKTAFNVPNLKANDEHIKLYLYVNRDMRVNATVHESVNSAEMDFAAVKLSEKIYDRKPVALGDSSQIKTRDVVYAMGYPADSVSNKEYNTKEDVSTVDGTISKVTVTGNVDIIEHTATLNLGNSGGPLLDANNTVIGVNSFVEGEKNYSIQINAIKKGLDTFGIPYVDGGAAPVTEPEDSEKEEKEADNSAILASLQSVVDEAKAVKAEDYSEESIAKLNDCIEAAEAVLAKGEEAEEAAITVATDDLNDAITGLEKKSGPNMILIGGIIAAAVIVVVIVIVVVASSKKKKKVVSTMKNDPVYPPQNDAYGTVPMSQVIPSQTMPSQEVPEGSGETTLLNEGAGETALLGGGQSAYLIRKKNGEKVVLNLQNFKIGKEKRRVNYCVSDNSTVSRLHCEIVRKGADYYVVDMGSANCTYVNGVQASPHKDTLLTDRSILKLSDEEFEFHLS